MTTPEEYHGHAEQARKLAADMFREDDRAFWLALAADWEKLARAADELRKGR